MSIERIPTKQGHPVPTSSHSPKGPFPPEIYFRPEVISEYYRPGQDDIIEGATAQNNFSPPKVFKCRDCSMLVLEHEIPDHQCPEGDEDGADA